MSKNIFIEDTPPQFENKFYKRVFFSIIISAILWGASYYLVYSTSYFDDRPYFYKPQRIDSIKKDPLLNLLVNGEYTKLNNQIDLMVKSSTNNDKDGALYDVMHTFARYDRGLTKFFDQWVQKYNNHGYPFMARAAYHQKIGSITRGSDYSRFINPIQSFRLNMYYDRALSDAYKAMQLMPASLVPHYQVLSISQIIKSKTEQKTIFEAGILIKPEDLNLRWMYISMLHPKWGGSVREMQALINESKKYYAINPKLKRLEGYLIAYRAEKIAEKGILCDAIDLYRQALETGGNSFLYRQYGEALACDNFHHEALDAFQKSVENWQHYFYSWQVLARVNIRLNHFEHAKEAINKAIVLNPVKASLYGDKAEIYLNLAQYDEGIASAEQAIKINNKEITFLEIGLFLKNSPSFVEKMHTLTTENNKYYKTINLIIRSKQNGNRPFNDEEYDDNGNIKYVYQYVNGKKNGIAYEYYPSMTVKYKWTYIDGKKSNPSFKYYENGSIQAEYNYVDGWLNGLTKGFFNTGELKSESYLINGKDEGIQKLFYKSGKLNETWTWKRGKSNGKAIRYLPSGEKMKEWNLINGKTVGKTIAYYRNGSIRYIATRGQDGMLHGEIKEYSIDGKLASQWIYDNDYLPGTTGLVQYNSKNNILYKNSITSFLTDMGTAGDNYTIFPKELDKRIIHSSFKDLKPGSTYNWKIEILNNYGNIVFTFNSNFTSTTKFYNMWYWHELFIKRSGTEKIIIYLDDQKLEEINVIM